MLKICVKSAKVETVTKVKLISPFMYCLLLRCSTARVSSSGLSLGGPTKVKACKSVLFRMGRRSSVKFVSFSEGCD